MGEQHGTVVTYPLGRHSVWLGIEGAERICLASHERPYYTNNLHAVTLKLGGVVWRGSIGLPQ